MNGIIKMELVSQIDVSLQMRHIIIHCLLSLHFTSRWVCYALQYLSDYLYLLLHAGCWLLAQLFEF